MKTDPLLIHKAQPIGNRPVPDCEIVIVEPYPRGDELRIQELRMHQEAERIVRALRDSLPQGTWAHVVALIAGAWATDQYGIISATAWNRPDFSAPSTAAEVPPEVQP